MSSSTTTTTTSLVMICSSTIVLIASTFLYSYSRKQRNARTACIQKFVVALEQFSEEEWQQVEHKLDKFLLLSSEETMDHVKKDFSESAAAADVIKEEVAHESNTKEVVNIKKKVEESDTSNIKVNDEKKVEEDPRLSRFRTMLKVGIEPEAVRHKMILENIDPNLLFPKEEMLNKPIVAVIPVPDDPRLEKFRKMLKFGIDKEAVRHKMVLEQLDPDLLQLGTASTKKLPANTPLKSRLIRVNCVSENKQNPNSLWKKLSNESKIQFGINSSKSGEYIEKMFRAQPKIATQQQKGKGQATVEQDENLPPLINQNNEKNKSQHNNNKKNVKKSLLPPRRAQNVQICFAKFKMSYEIICRSILEMQFDGDEDQLQLLLLLVPSQEEMDLMRSYQSEISILTDADKLLWTLSCKVPDSKLRVESMIFMTRFPNLVVEVTKKIETSRRACNFVLKSESVANLMKIIKFVVFCVNSEYSTLPNIEEVGIQIHGLTNQLLQTKSADGKFNVCDIIASFFVNKTNDVPIFESSFSELSSISSLEREVQDIGKGVEACGIISCKHNLDIFIETARKQVQVMDKEMNFLKEEYLQVLHYFAEDMSRPLGVFFQDLSSLVFAIQAALVTPTFTFPEIQ